MMECHFVASCIRRFRVVFVVSQVAIFLSVAGCVPGDREMVEGAASPDAAGFQRPVDETLLVEGKQIYELYCIGCHGENGDGNGVAADVLHPRPRNFITAKYKFSTRRSGSLPGDDDLFRTITNGLRGTSMPSWKLIPLRQRWALVAYVKSFSDEWANQGPSPAIPFAEDPYASNLDRGEAIARGEAVYHGLTQCWTCHPAYVSTEKINDYLEVFENTRREFFRDDLGSAVSRVSSEGEVVFVPDFLRDYVRAGHQLDVLYRSISAGITGTAMPTWIDSIEIAGDDGALLAHRGDLWALSYYVQDLIARRPSRRAEGDFVLRHHAMDTSQDKWVPVVAAELAATADDDDDEEEDEGED